MVRQKTWRTATQLGSWLTSTTQHKKQMRFPPQAPPRAEHNFKITCLLVIWKINVIAYIAYLNHVCLISKLVTIYLQTELPKCTSDVCPVFLFFLHNHHALWWHGSRYSWFLTPRVELINGGLTQPWLQVLWILAAKIQRTNQNDMYVLDLWFFIIWLVC